MANVLYNSGRQKFLEGSISWSSDNIKAILVDTGVYTFSTAHDFLDDITGGSIIATSGNFASKTTTDGIADAADVTFTAVSTPTSVEALVIYKDSGSAATSPLIAYIDTATGLPVTPNGGDITVAWDNSTNKIFKL